MLSLAASLRDNSRFATTTVDADRALVARFRAGETAVFDCIFRQNQDYVYRLCVGMLAHEGWAQDVTQDVFLRAYRSLGRFRGEASLRTWLYRIAINECMQQLRKPRREESAPDVVDSVLATATTAEEGFRQSLEMEHVRQALRQLAPSHRAALTLRYFEEMSYEEIAEAMSSSGPRVRALLHRAREAFRAAYLKLARWERL